MATSPPRGMQSVIPYVYVEDVDAYLDFLVRAFGFEKRIHHVDPDDPSHVHAEVSLDDSVVMIGHAVAKWGTRAATGLPALHAATFVYVDDVDAHFERARANGATIEVEPEDRSWGARMYQARDPEGNQWYFATAKP